MKRPAQLPVALYPGATIRVRLASGVTFARVLDHSATHVTVALFGTRQRLPHRAVVA